LLVYLHTTHLMLSIKHGNCKFMGVGREGLAPPPWIFTHGTNIVNRGLIVLFFRLIAFRCFFPLPPLGRGLIILFFVFFFVGPPAVQIVIYRPYFRLVNYDLYYNLLNQNISMIRGGSPIGASVLQHPQSFPPPQKKIKII